MYGILYVGIPRIKSKKVLPTIIMAVSVLILAALFFSLDRYTSVPLDPISAPLPLIWQRQHLLKSYILDIASNEPDYPGRMALTIRPIWNKFFWGNPVIMAVNVYNPSDEPYIYRKAQEETTEKHLIVSNFPARKNGGWENGSMEITGPGARLKKNGTPIPSESFSGIIPPGKRYWGKFILNDVAEFRKPGTYRIRMEIKAFSNTLQRELTLEGETEFTIIPIPPVSKRKSGEILFCIASALENYCVDWSGFPSPRFEKDFPCVPQILTTPLPYLSPERWKETKGLAYFNNPWYGRSSWMVASMGPDGDWDIDPLLKSDDIYSWEDIYSFFYDPTNGIHSSGDSMLIAPGVIEGAAPYFRIWGARANRETLKRIPNIP
ncbi:hypothetical protein JW926_07845 [Candidatus Sumerlaeota bacterium]|nr:hypothetical protein [Candidatus Sumerlaeota bacterium]